MGRRIEKAGLRAAWLLLGSCLGFAAEAGTLESPGCLAGGAPAVVTQIDERLDLHLADGRIVHLPGIAVADREAGARQALAAWLDQATVAVSPLQTGLDRWGRTVALVFADPRGTSDRPVSVVEALVDAGLALARPDPALERCWPMLTRLERSAAQGGTGLWRSGPALRPGDAAGLQERKGIFTVVEGRIASVHEGRARIYLRFAEAGATGMALTMTRPVLKRFVTAGTDPQAWIGHTLRVRGFLDDRWGWQIEVATPQQVDLDQP